MTDITNSNTATKIGMTQAYTGTLSAVTGKYLPDSITVTMGGNPTTYTYNNLTGVLSIISVTGNVVITAVAADQIKLDAPIIDLTGSILMWTTVNNATLYSIRSNGTEVTTSTGTSIDLSTILTDEGAYVMTVVATASGFTDSVASNSISFTVAPQGETWILNVELDTSNLSVGSISFTNKGNTYNSIYRGYLSGSFSENTLKFGDVQVYDESGWLINDRTLIFETAPTGDLLTWLQANAVKQ